MTNRRGRPERTGTQKPKQDTFNSWIVDLEEKEQPEACSIDNEDCENCGS